MSELTPESRKPFEHLCRILRDTFQLDRGDLDFGLYRIMNMKSNEINKFLESELLPQVREILSGLQIDALNQIDEEIRKSIDLARTLQVDPEESAKIHELRQRKEDILADRNAEAEVYNHLAQFLSRYYYEGDFLPLRRYSSGGQSSYLIPYEGEEFKVHWANFDQYYVKSTENYGSFAFTVGSGRSQRRVNFEIVFAENEKDNIKESSKDPKRFVLAPRDAVEANGNSLVIRFEHRSLSRQEKIFFPGTNSNQQNKINMKIADQIFESVDSDWLTLLASPTPTECNSDRTILAKHLTTYTAKNSYDYFIHKDLGPFLRRELEMYGKTEVLRIENLSILDYAQFYRTVSRIRAIQHIGDKIITFLAQIEDFQKNLWLKKKFVLETQYCVTLDLIPESFYDEIIANESQCNEWVVLYAIDEIVDDLGNGGICYSNPLTIEFLKANPNLIVDTKHFDSGFKDQLIATLCKDLPLEQRLNGLLVHGDNFQALNLLQARYENQVKAIYIDPPYNTDSSPILYKNNYKDSTWLSFMADRLSQSKKLLSEDGMICVAIDDVEAAKLRELLTSIFEREVGISVVRSNPAGRKTKGRLAPSHEYAMFFGTSDSAIPGSLEKSEKSFIAYPESDEEGRFTWTNFIRSGSNDLRSDRPKMYYPIYVDQENNIRIPKMKWSEENHEYLIESDLKENEVAIYPVGQKDGKLVDKCWQRGYERTAKELDEFRIKRNGNNDKNITVQFKKRMDEASRPNTWWADNKYASALRGAREQKELFGAKKFDFPKARKLVTDCIEVVSSNEDDCVVLDYFAGSGTSGQAVINQNRENNGNRKYVLVEVGHHFDEILLPRVKKSVYASEWKDGKPASRNGVSQVIKYITTEGYEDTLDSLEVLSASEDMLTKVPSLKEDFKLRYQLSSDTAGSACLAGKDFTNPFAYTLSVNRDGHRSDTFVDLPETFNYLLGLRVETRRMIDGILSITGTNSSNERYLILWRNLKKTDNTRLEDWIDRNLETISNSLNYIFVNGDQTLNSIAENRAWKAKSIEPVFRELMFDD